jgi:hypothetical protein
MRMRTLTLLILSATASATAVGAPPPERVVDSATIISARDPRMHIQVPAAAKYLGAERWDLYDIADCEVHVFVEAGADRIVKRLYWIQFEGYLPHVTYTYDYSKDEPRSIQGLDFWTRARFGPTDAPNRAGSDREHVYRMIAHAGYTLPPQMMNVRLVHLLDDAKRRELMLIYSEDLAPTGFTPDTLQHGDEPAPEWQALQKTLLEHAARRVRFIR